MSGAAVSTSVFTRGSATPPVCDERTRQLLNAGSTANHPAECVFCKEASVLAAQGTLVVGGGLTGRGCLVASGEVGGGAGGGIRSPTCLGLWPPALFVPPLCCHPVGGGGPQGHRAPRGRSPCVP